MQRTEAQRNLSKLCSSFFHQAMQHMGYQFPHQELNRHPVALEVWRLNHWTSRKVPKSYSSFKTMAFKHFWAMNYYKKCRLRPSTHTAAKVSEIRAYSCHVLFLFSFIFLINLQPQSEGPTLRTISHVTFMANRLNAFSPKPSELLALSLGTLLSSDQTWPCISCSARTWRQLQRLCSWEGQ